MTEYAAGTVAEVTWDNATLNERSRGESRIKAERAIRTKDGRWSLVGRWDHCVDDAAVTDVRPLILLDLDGLVEPQTLANFMRATGLCGSRAIGDALADQIEAQKKPPRIPEPGLWGVVRSGAGLDCVRTGPTPATSREWLCDNGARADWDEISLPTLVRPGIEDES